MNYVRKPYIPLGQRVSLQEQKILERSICEVLTVTLPTETFVIELECELIAAARRQHQHPPRVWQGLGVVGLIGGGLLSIAGGVWIWLRWRRHSPQSVTFTPRAWVRV